MKEINTRKASKLLGVSHQALSEWRISGKIKGRLDKDRNYYYDRAEIERLRDDREAKRLAKFSEIPKPIELKPASLPQGKAPEALTSYLQILKLLQLEALTGSFSQDPEIADGYTFASQWLGDKIKAERGK